MVSRIARARATTTLTLAVMQHPALMKNRNEPVFAWWRIQAYRPSVMSLWSFRTDISYVNICPRRLNADFRISV